MPAFSETIDGPWLDVAPVRVGRVPAYSGTPDRYLTALIGDEQRVRVDLYRGEEACAFEDACEWRGWLVVGWGEHLHWVEAAGRAAQSLHLGSYFGHLYPAPDALFVASAERLFRFDSSGELVWSSGKLGIDGVVLESWSGEVLAGRGEWDPPGGWQPFRISQTTGRSLDAKPGAAPDPAGLDRRNEAEKKNRQEG